MPPDSRELVFCHSCEDEWYRDESGLICPRCSSDIVEIIDPDTDPRHQEDDSHEQQHPLHEHDPWNTANAPDPDEDMISDNTFRSGAGIQNGSPSINPFDNIISSLLGGMQGPGQNPGGEGFGGNARATGNPYSSSGSFTFSMSTGPNGMRFTRTTGSPIQGGFGSNNDLEGILDQLFNFMAPQGARAPGQQQPGAPTMHPLFGILMRGMPGGHGDAVYSQEGFDRILTMLREQHGGATGPPPATEEAIAALPKVNINKEHLDEQGKAECSICMDQVQMGDEVTKLPCDHWFHGECIQSWLKEHDTCPQCRRGITPREGDQNQPRTTGQAPRNWQVNEGDIEGLLRRDSQSGGQSSTNTNTASGSQTTGTGRSNINVVNVASNFIRRLTGGGSTEAARSSSGNNNNTTNSDTNQRS